MKAKKLSKAKTKGKITKDMKLGEVISKHPQTLIVFEKAGLHCIECFGAAYETIEEGAKAHGIDLEKLLKELNKKVK